jgi:hypothetical protein
VFNNNGFDMTNARATCAQARISFASFEQCVNDVFNNNGFDMTNAREVCTAFLRN